MGRKAYLIGRPFDNKVLWVADNLQELLLKDQDGIEEYVYDWLTETKFGHIYLYKTSRYTSPK